MEKPVKGVRIIWCNYAVENLYVQRNSIGRRRTEVDIRSEINIGKDRMWIDWELEMFFNT